MDSSSKKLSFMIKSLPHRHKVHNKYWMFKEDYEDCSWRIMIEKPASHATKRICFDVMRQNSHWVLCHILWGFTTTTNINENDAFIEDLQNLLKVSCYQSLSRGESLRIIFHEFTNKLMQKAYKFQSFSKLENGTFQWWVLSCLH